MIKYSSCHKVAVEEFTEIPHYVCSKCAQPCEVVETPSIQQPSCITRCGDKTCPFPDPTKCSIYLKVTQSDASRLLTDEAIRKLAKWRAYALQDHKKSFDLIKIAQDAKTYPIAFEAGRKEGYQKGYESGFTDGQISKMGV